MRLDSNTIFITGGGAGIGRGLAEAFNARGNRVVIGGRREAVLASVCAENAGMSYIVLDVADRASIRAAAGEMARRFPDLNCLINNAGIQRAHDFGAAAGVNLDDVAAEIATNFSSVVEMCAAFVPLLRAKAHATIVNVSSGLAFVPLAKVPVYCATKAAVHSFCVSLRHQLRGAAVAVVELIPPYVATDLQQGRSGAGPAPMPLAEFIKESMRLLAGDEVEVAVGPAKFLRSAAGEDWRAVFARMNSE